MLEHTECRPQVSDCMKTTHSEYMVTIRVSNPRQGAFNKLSTSRRGIKSYLVAWHLGHRSRVMKRQHRSPQGKKMMARRIPTRVYSVCMFAACRWMWNRFKIVHHLLFSTVGSSSSSLFSSSDEPQLRSFLSVFAADLPRRTGNISPRR